MNNVDFWRANGERFIRQYIYDPILKNEDEAPMWCLGRRYDCKPRRSSPRRPSQKGQPATTPGDTLSDDNPHGGEGSLPATKSDSGSSDGSPASQTASSTNETNSTRTTPEAEAAHDAGGNADTQEAEADNGWPTPFLEDIESKLWMTYRSNFPNIARSQQANLSLKMRLKQIGNQAAFTSDTGFGCMIRSGQSLLANALVQLRLGRDWRYGQRLEEERQLLALFADQPSAPFSIHCFVEYGALACGKPAGEWFGPSATARCIQALSKEYKDTGLQVYARFDDADVYTDGFMRIAKAEDGSFKPTLILLGVMLGIDRVMPVYWDALKAALQMPQSIGIAGGRPSASHYFIGTQSDSLFYLDPHHTRPAIPLDPSTDDIASCHTRRLRRIHVKEMDPSMLLAFLIRSEEDFGEWRRAVAAVRGKAIVHVHDAEPTYQRTGGERAGAIDEVESCDEDDGLVVVA
ncbi:Cysteine protease atg4 [Elasticomyces elasticus]|nr:Cysteine protease atg4 [Elasticomyces elasticus]